MKPFICFHTAIFSSSFACKSTLRLLLFVVDLKKYAQIVIIYVRCTVRRMKAHCIKCFVNIHSNIKTFPFDNFCSGFLAQSILHPLPNPFMQMFHSCFDAV